MKPAEYLKQQIESSGLTKKEWYWQVYLKSDHWNDLRTTALENANHRCCKCGCGGKLDVHHERYKSIFNVTQDDLSVMCRKCHHAEHEGKKDIRRANRKPRKPKTKTPQKPVVSKKKAKVQRRKLLQAYRRGKKEAGGTPTHRVIGGVAMACRVAAGFDEVSTQAKSYLDKIKSDLQKLLNENKPISADPVDKLSSKIKKLF